MDSVDLNDDASMGSGGRFKGPPPVQPAPERGGRKVQPSMSIEQAAKPTFDITVGDPHKVGDITSSHIVYQVRTKVSSGYVISEGDASAPNVVFRLPLKATASPNSNRPAVTAIFSGFTPLFITTILVSSFLLLPRNKPLAALTATSSSRDARLWSAC